MTVSDTNRDPLGKRALFSNPGESSASKATQTKAAPKSRLPKSQLPKSGSPRSPRASADGSSNRAGVKALYSVDTEPRLGTVVVECSDCLEHTRISVLDAGVRMWSFSLWIPGKRFSRHLSCPACGRRTWCRIRWTD